MSVLATRTSQHALSPLPQSETGLVIQWYRWRYVKGLSTYSVIPGKSIAVLRCHFNYLAWFGEKTNSGNDPLKVTPHNALLGACEAQPSGLDGVRESADLVDYSRVYL